MSDQCYYGEKNNSRFAYICVKKCVLKYISDKFEFVKTFAENLQSAGEGQSCLKNKQNFIKNEYYLKLKVVYLAQFASYRVLSVIFEITSLSLDNVLLCSTQNSDGSSRVNVMDYKGGDPLRDSCYCLTGGYKSGRIFSCCHEDEDAPYGCHEDAWMPGFGVLIINIINTIKSKNVLVLVLVLQLVYCVIFYKACYNKD